MCNLKPEDFFESSKDLLCIINENGCFERVNQAFCAASGYLAPQLVNRPVSDFASFKNNSGELSMLQNLTHTDSLESSFHCSDNTCKWFSWSRNSLPGYLPAFIRVNDITKEKSLEQKLFEALEEKQNILDSSLDLICTLNAAGVFLSVNKACKAVLGYLPSELIGKTYNKFIYQADIELADRAFAELLSSKEAINFGNRIIHKDGSLVSIDWSSRWSEKDQRVFSIGRDVSEKNKQTQLICLQERRSRALVQSGSDLISILDENGICVYVSPSIEKLGYAAEFFLGKTTFDFIHPHDADKVAEAFAEIKTCPRLEVPVFRFLDSSGNWRWVKAIATNMLDDPSINGIVLNSRDITESLKIEVERQSALSRIKNLIENFTEGFILLNRNWDILDFNPKTAELLQVNPDALKNQSISEIFPKDQNEGLYNKCENALQNNITVCFTHYTPLLNKWFEITAYPYQGDLTVFLKDITVSKVQTLTIKLEKDVLEMNTRSDSTLKNVADFYLLGLSDIYPGLKFTAAVADKQKNLLYPLASPALPADYARLLQDGFPIGPESGICGAAAYFKNSFGIKNISTHPNTAPYKDALAKMGLFSCWSIPVIDEEDNLMATVAVYYNKISEPTLAEEELIKRISTFIKILIENQKTKEGLHMISERYRLVNLASKDAIYDWDILGNELYWGEGFEKIFGYKDPVTTIFWWEERIHPEDFAVISSSLETTLKTAGSKYWHAEYRFLRANGCYAFIIEDGYIIRDEEGRAIRMVGTMQDCSKIKEHQQEILRQNEVLKEIAKINSHYIRKPLANILGLIAAIKAAEKSELKELINMLESSGCELDDITRQIAGKTYR